MSSIQYILEKEKEAENILKEAEIEALKIRQEADKKQIDDLEELDEILAKEKTEKIDRQTEQLLHIHKEISEKGKKDNQAIFEKVQQHKKKTIDLVLEKVSE